MATFTGMSVKTFSAEAKQWLDKAKDPRWNKPHIAFGNSTGDQQMLEYTKAGAGSVNTYGVAALAAFAMAVGQNLGQQPRLYFAGVTYRYRKSGRSPR